MSCSQNVKNGIRKVVEYLGTIHPLIKTHSEVFQKIIKQSFRSNMMAKNWYGSLCDIISETEPQSFTNLKGVLTYNFAFYLDFEIKDFLSAKFVTKFYGKPLEEIMSDFEFLNEMFSEVKFEMNEMSDFIKLHMDQFKAKFIFQTVTAILSTLYLRMKYACMDTQNEMHNRITHYLLGCTTEDHSIVSKLVELPETVDQHKLCQQCGIDLIGVMTTEFQKIQSVLKRFTIMTNTERQTYVKNCPDIQLALGMLHENDDDFDFINSTSNLPIILQGNPGLYLYLADVDDSEQYSGLELRIENVDSVDLLSIDI